MAQLVVLHPNTLAPLLPLFVVKVAGDEKSKGVKVQGVGPRNCPVAQLKINAATGFVFFFFFFFFFFSSPAITFIFLFSSSS